MDLYKNDDGTVHTFSPELEPWSPYLPTVDTPLGEHCHICKVIICLSDFGVTQIYVGEDMKRIALHRLCFWSSMGIEGVTEVESLRAQIETLKQQVENQSTQLRTLKAQWKL